jgi:hypothetical protein
VSTDGLLVCEKNISVSHIANGSTRLQPVVMNIGQAAGMAAALGVELGCQPRDLPVRRIQEALLQDAVAPAAIIPLFNLPFNRPDWLYWQQHYLDNPEDYPSKGNVEKGKGGEGDRSEASSQTFKQSVNSIPPSPRHPVTASSSIPFTGIFQRYDEQDYRINLTEPGEQGSQTWTLITLQPEVEEQLKTCINQQQITVWGHLNKSGSWLVVENLYTA